LDQAAAEARAAEQMPAGTTPPDASDEYLALMDKLRETVKKRPDDPRGLMLLARNEAALGNMTAARKAQAQLIDVKGEQATAQDYALLADLMISAAGGYVSSDAEAAIRNALARDPRNPWARYFLGHYMIQVDRPDMAFRTWEKLLDESGANAPWVEPIRARIEEVAWRAGVQYELPPLEQDTAPGPDAADMEAAGEMSAEDRAEMIRGMVSRLAERLANEGGTAREWARLIGAYGVLGETERAQAIWDEAQQVFAGREQDLGIVRAAARDAGLVE
ncbi:tetratricopeptide repeat protein, partial [Roseovarius salis]|uniref:tetratricopeptide repeat protein n=1 Tax=Roseovarius salis TaxID=3376063 RepID=UPI0037CB1AC8